MKDITLKIMGDQISGLAGADVEGETMEFITEGRLLRKGDSLYLEYEESDLAGMEGCTTSLEVSGHKVKMERYGDEIGYETTIEFEEGKRWDGYYHTPFGPIKMEVLTNEVKSTLDEVGTGGLWIDCSVSLKGLTNSRNRLSFEIM